MSSAAAATSPPTRAGTTGASRSSPCGEGWHNNHHYYADSARQGFFWWELDVSYYILKMLSWVGVVRDLKVPPAHVKAAARVRDGQFDIGMFRAEWNKATATLTDAGQALADNRLGAPADVAVPELVASPELVSASVGAASGPSTVTAEAEQVLATATHDDHASRHNHVKSTLQSNKAALDECLQNALRQAPELAKAAPRGPAPAPRRLTLLADSWVRSAGP